MRRLPLGPILLLATLLVFVQVACESVPVGSMGQELVNGQLGVTVTNYELRYLDLQAESGAVQTTERPVLLVKLSITNHGTSAIRYDTREATTTAQQALSPVLFVAPSEDRELTAADNIAVVSLGQFRYLDDPITGAVTIAADQTIFDTLLFEAPPEGASTLRLSLPPTMFGPTVERPAWIEIPYTASEPIGLPEVAQGETITGNGFTFRVDRSEVAYLPNRDETGFVEQPVLAIYYTVGNASTEQLTYQPPHRIANGDTAPALAAGEVVMNRVLVPAQQGLANQMSDPQVIPVDGSISDFAVFERPDAAVSELLFYFKGHTVGQTGQVRVRLPYAFIDPPLPDALLPPTPEVPAEAPEE